MQRAGLWYKVVFAAFFCMAALSFLGCSSQKRYEVLSYFFDGVPVPGGVKTSDQPAVYTHKPYADAKCGQCHASDNIDMSITTAVNIQDIPSSVCLKCHDKVRSEYKVMHGPVSSVECLMCHTPHQSTIAHLLAAPPDKVCGQCHTPENMVPVRPEHADLKANCLDCHSGHGGAAHGLLKAKPAGAATKPSATSANPAEGVAQL